MKIFSSLNTRLIETRVSQDDYWAIIKLSSNVIGEIFIQISKIRFFTCTPREDAKKNLFLMAVPFRIGGEGLAFKKNELFFPTANVPSSSKLKPE